MAVLSGVTPRLLCIAALAAGVAGFPGPAQAARPLDAAASPTCRPGAQASATDQAVADRLRPSMTGRRLGSWVTGRSVACARIIVERVQERGFAPRAAVIALTTAIAESTLNNHTVARDHDSLGLFQQRPSQGWGRPDQLVDPRYATDAFLAAMVRKFPGDSWMSGDIGAICQRVQTSAYPAAYSPEAQDAELMVAALWPSGRAVAARPAPATPAKPPGPFERAVAAAGAVLGPLEGRHGLALADWNGDRRDDLVVVHGAGAGTGKTEIRVMDGVSNYSFLLVNTATALGPTDERHAFAVADLTGDGRADLLVVQRSGTASGRTEVRVVDGASHFQNVVLETTTPLPPTGEQHQFSVADWNGDGRPDLVVAQTSGTASKKVEVQVLDGAAGFQRQLTPAITTAEPAREGLQASARDWNGDRRPDLVVLRQAAKTEVRVLDGAGQLRRPLVEATTPVHTDDKHELLVTDANGDGRPDLAVVQKAGTATGRAEITVLGG